MDSYYISNIELLFENIRGYHDLKNKQVRLLIKDKDDDDQEIILSEEDLNKNNEILKNIIKYYQYIYVFLSIILSIYNLLKKFKPLLNQDFEDQLLKRKEKVTIGLSNFIAAQKVTQRQINKFDDFAKAVQDASEENTEATTQENELSQYRPEPLTFKERYIFKLNDLLGQYNKMTNYSDQESGYTREDILLRYSNNTDVGKKTDTDRNKESYRIQFSKYKTMDIYQLYKEDTRLRSLNEIITLELGNQESEEHEELSILFEILKYILKYLKKIIGSRHKEYKSSLSGKSNSDLRTERDQLIGFISTLDDIIREIELSPEIIANIQVVIRENEIKLSIANKVILQKYPKVTQSSIDQRDTHETFEDFPINEPSRPRQIMNALGNAFSAISDIKDLGSDVNESDDPTEDVDTFQIDEGVTFEIDNDYSSDQEYTFNLNQLPQDYISLVDNPVSELEQLRQLSNFDSVELLLKYKYIAKKLVSSSGKNNDNSYKTHIHKYYKMENSDLSNEITKFTVLSQYIASNITNLNIKNRVQKLTKDELEKLIKLNILKYILNIILPIIIEILKNNQTFSKDYSNQLNYDLKEEIKRLEDLKKAIESELRLFIDSGDYTKIEFADRQKVIIDQIQDLNIRIPIATKIFDAKPNKEVDDRSYARRYVFGQKYLKYKQKYLNLKKNTHVKMNLNSDLGLSEDEYNIKYLKYKEKYLLLKNNII